MGDEEVMGTLRIWLEFLFEHDDAVGMDMAVEVENLNINESQEDVANREGNDAGEESGSDDGAANPGVDSEGHRGVEDEDADSSFSSVTSSSTTSSSSEDDAIRLVSYDESTDSGIDLPDSDQEYTDKSTKLKRVEHADASDENSDDDPQPVSSREVPRNLEGSPDNHAGAAWDSEEDPQPGPSRKRRRNTRRDEDSEEDALHRPPLKMVRKSDAGSRERAAATSYDFEEESMPGPSRREEHSQRGESDQRVRLCCDHSDCDALFEEQSQGISQKEQKDKAEED